MVMVFVPSMAEPLAVKVILASSVVGFRINEAVTPLGNPEATRLTLPVKPLTGAIVATTVPEEPIATVRDVGLAASEKSGVELACGCKVTLWDVDVTCAESPR